MPDMTTHPLLLMTGAYFLELIAAIYFTRAAFRRVMGALAGGLCVGAMALGMIAVCQALGWWGLPFASTPYLMALLGVGLVISCSPIYLITWRLARRFGWRGLAVFAGVVTVIGPPRDYLIAAKYPEWMVFSPGIAPMIADAVAYLGIGARGACRYALRRRGCLRGSVRAKDRSRPWTSFLYVSTLVTLL